MFGRVRNHPYNIIKRARKQAFDFSRNVLFKITPGEREFPLDLCDFLFCKKMVLDRHIGTY